MFLENKKCKGIGLNQPLYQCYAAVFYLDFR